MIEVTEELLKILSKHEEEIMRGEGKDYNYLMDFRVTYLILFFPIKREFTITATTPYKMDRELLEYYKQITKNNICKINPDKDIISFELIGIREIL